ncbi:MAG: polysaccharide pyruvyl transferase family protein [Verrucomicrobiales bacterium]|nr:polysaccharide pyruvyl transferase family protein [Verrucomicrobiales bacterium]
MIGLYSYSSNNIGDDIQSLVLRRWLNYRENEVVFVDRDRHTITGTCDENITLLINGFIGGGALPVYSGGGFEIDPVFVAVHLYVIDKDPGKLEQLTRAAPVGCRDLITRRRCIERGIPAYFSACPTILCEPADVKQDIDILLVDVDPRSLPKLPERSIRYSTNMISPAIPFHKRREMCLRRWELLSRSRLVVTSKLHAAMPALGMGKPVVFVKEKIIAPERLSAFPKNFRLYKKGEGFSWDPETHYCDTSAHRRLVESRLLKQLGRYRKHQFGAN